MEQQLAELKARVEALEAGAKGNKDKLDLMDQGLSLTALAVESISGSGLLTDHYHKP